jgi:serine/threonine-protein kinase
MGAITIATSAHHDDLMRTMLLAIALAIATRSTVPAASADDSADDSTYGAIAWSPSTGALGTTWGQPDSDYASQVARRNCMINSNWVASDCRVMTWEGNQYAALAVDRNGAVMTNTGTDWAQLRDSLLADCAAYSGRGCRIATWVYR